ncbi:MAG: hypothetical protein QXU32_07595 [Nitrososphaerales archaeon]
MVGYRWAWAVGLAALLILQIASLSVSPRPAEAHASYISFSAFTSTAPVIDGFVNADE